LLDNKELRLCHRLDRTTTGILIVAKKKQSAKDITALFKANKILKIYLTIVKGIPKQSSGNINTPLITNVVSGKEKISADKEGSIKALTGYEVLKKNKNISLLRVLPKTGRKHQIRAHLQSIGVPILGDNKYSSINHQQKNVTRMHLHASSVKFKLYGTSHQIKADIPKPFKEILKLYGLDNN
tara:strand:- start:975 stop:1523 length:549 start_codon:yes stop_codon:yes gene_type:complete